MLAFVDGETVLETARLRLEPLTPAHAPLLFPVLADARIYPYLPEEPPENLDSLAQRYQRLATRRSADGMELWLNWAVQHKATQAYLGTLQATVMAKEPALLAYLINPTVWGYGYAQEGCHRILALLFTGYQVQSVQAEVDTRNRPSCTLLARLGFQQIGVRPNADHFKGASSDEYTYELTAKAWQATRADEIRK